MIDEQILETVLGELRLSNEGTWGAADGLDQKANFVFAGGSVVFGVIAAIELGRQGPRGLLVWVLLGLSIVLYGAMTVRFVSVISPRKYGTALREDRQTIEREMLDRDHSIARLGLIEGYILTIAHNREENNKKARGVVGSAWLMAGLLLGLFALGVLHP